MLMESRWFGQRNIVCQMLVAFIRIRLYKGIIKLLPSICSPFSEFVDTAYTTEGMGYLLY